MNSGFRIEKPGDEEGLAPDTFLQEDGLPAWNYLLLALSLALSLVCFGLSYLITAV